MTVSLSDAFRFLLGAIMMETMTTLSKTENKVSRAEVACLGVVLLGAFALLLPALPASREAARNNLCRRNLRWLDLTAQTYVAAKSRLPHSMTWPIELLPYLQDLTGQDTSYSGVDVFTMPRPMFLTCPSRPDVTRVPGIHQVSHYAMVVSNDGSAPDDRWRFRDAAPNMPGEPDVKSSWFVGSFLTPAAAEEQLRSQHGPHANRAFLESDGQGNSVVRELLH